MNRVNAIYSPPVYSPPRVLYQDEYLMAVDKPTGLLSVPGRGVNKQDCLSARVQRIFPEARVVHRLDMETSGLLLFARSEKTQRLLGQLFENRKISKTYIAVVHGKPPTESGLIDVPLMADWPNRPKQKVNFEQGKPSQTRYQLLSYNLASNQSRLRLEPVTGRSHQLRVHLHYLGHPIVGDALYCDPEMGSQPVRLMLHASDLDFLHPHTGAQLTISCPASF